MSFKRIHLKTEFRGHFINMAISPALTNQHFVVATKTNHAFQNGEKPLVTNLSLRIHSIFLSTRFQKGKIIKYNNDIFLLRA